MSNGGDLPLDPIFVDDFDLAVERFAQSGAEISFDLRPPAGIPALAGLEACSLGRPAITDLVIADGGMCGRRTAGSHRVSPLEMGNPAARQANDRSNPTNEQIPGFKIYDVNNLPRRLAMRRQ
jgi:hypothetical protein